MESQDVKERRSYFRWFVVVEGSEMSGEADGNNI